MKRQRIRSRNVRSLGTKNAFFAGVVAYLLILGVLIKKLPNPSSPQVRRPQHQHAGKNNLLGLATGSDIPNKTNILVAMAIDCTSIGNISDITRSIQVPANSNVELFWNFNIYNAKSEKCTNQTPRQVPRVRITKENTVKNIFWLKILEPQKVQVEFNTRFDFVWMVDSDLLLEALNFGAFLHIVQTLDFGIAQPAILGACVTCRGSDHPQLNKIPEPDLTIIAKTASIVEIMTPFMKFEVWKQLHPLLEAVYPEEMIELRSTYSGPDLWWCGYVWDQIKQSKQNIDIIPLAAYPCGVVHATPLLHMNTQTVKKGDEFIERNQRAIRRHEIMYPAYFESAKELSSEQVFTVTDVYPLSRR